MALDKLVTEVNADLKAQLSDLKGHRENPRIIKLVETLIRLTNSEDDNEAMDEAAPDPKEIRRKEIAAQIAALQKEAAKV